MKIKKGFTLIELLVVIAIIGILATLAVVAFGSAQRKGKDSKRVSDVRAVIAAFAAANTEGYDICDTDCGTPIGAANTAIDTLQICAVPCDDAASIPKTTDFINLSQVIDPDDNATPCDGSVNPTGVDCAYAISASAEIDDFNLYFFTEEAVQNLNPGPHTANQNGILQ